MWSGAVNGTRTRDPQLGKLVLYQLSYCRMRNCIYHFPVDKIINYFLNHWHVSKLF